MDGRAGRIEERRRAPDPREDRGGDRRRYFDPQVGGTVVKILPGDYYVTDDPGETIATILGSCVAACVRDPSLGIGGMNHFMAPESETGTWSGRSALQRYGNFAMEALINDVLARGGRRDRLEVKVFGGANVIRSSLNVGDRNAAFVTAYLAREGMPVAAADLGGDLPRRVLYRPGTGRAQRLILNRDADKAVFAEEQAFRRKLEQEPRGGDVELFD